MLWYRSLAPSLHTGERPSPQRDEMFWPERKPSGLPHPGDPVPLADPRAPSARGRAARPGRPRTDAKQRKDERAERGVDLCRSRDPVDQECQARRTRRRSQRGSPHGPRSVTGSPSVAAAPRRHIFPRGGHQTWIASTILRHRVRRDRATAHASRAAPAAIHKLAAVLDSGCRVQLGGIDGREPEAGSEAGPRVHPALRAGEHESAGARAQRRCRGVGTARGLFNRWLRRRRVIHLEQLPDGHSVAEMIFRSRSALSGVQSAGRRTVAHPSTYSPA
jgi:hypothetical protein